MKTNPPTTRPDEPLQQTTQLWRRALRLRSTECFAAQCHVVRQTRSKAQGAAVDLLTCHSSSPHRIVLDYERTTHVPTAAATHVVLTERW
jgi:hypothetical protein